MAKCQKFKRLSLQRLYGSQCWYCLSPLSKIKSNGVVDHITPRSRGGSNKRQNLALACDHCDKGKGGRNLLEFVMGLPAGLIGQRKMNS
jgi:5-methylcytosine-specific restriction endonuclease McrA